MAGEGQGRERSQLAGPCQRVLESADTLHEPETVRVRAVERLCRKEHRPRRAVAGEEGDPLHRPVVDHQPELGGGDAETGVGRGQPQVARGRELHARAEGGAVDRGQRDERHLGQGVEHPAQHACEPRAFHPRQVGAGAEMATGAGEHQHACVGGSVDRSQQVVERLGVDGVATLLAVDRDEDDRAASLGVDHVSSITAMTSPSCTWSSGATRSSATVPDTGASTGISIFIDSRITSSSPSATI